MRTLHIAHQFDAARHDWMRQILPADARLDQLPPDDPWRVPAGTTVLLVNHGKLRSLSRSKPAWADGVEWMHIAPTGLDEAPDWLFNLPHITVSRGAAAVAIAEYVLAAMLDFEKRPSEVRVTAPALWVPGHPGSIAGRSLGLFGFGEIGRAIAERALAFRMSIRATRRHSDAPMVQGVELVSLDDLCALSDHLVLCAPLTPDTAGSFDDARFGLCKPGQHLINIARGALIQPEALRRALDSRIARASLDVWTEEPPQPGDWVYDHPRLHLTAHTSARGPSTEARQCEILEANLTAWVAARPEALFGRVNRSGRY